MAKIGFQLWKDTLNYIDTCIHTGVKYSRVSIANELEITDSLARDLLACYVNKELIKQIDINSIEVIGKELFVADFHIPFQNDVFIDLMLDFVSNMNINRITFGGDVLDFFRISRFPKLYQESDVSLNNEFKIARELLQRFRELYPFAIIDFIEGNHEERMQKYIADKAPEIQGLSYIKEIIARELNLKELHIDYKTQPYSINGLWHDHGHNLNKAGSAKFLSKLIHDKTRQSTISGHSHRTDTHVQKTIDPKIEYTSCSVGCCAELSQLDYNKCNNWNNGFAIVDYFETDNGMSFEIFNYEYKNNKFKVV